MTTDSELRDAITEYRAGTFLKKRFPGNYRKKAEIDRYRSQITNDTSTGHKVDADVVISKNTNCAVDSNADPK